MLTKIEDGMYINLNDISALEDTFIEGGFNTGAARITLVGGGILRTRDARAEDILKLMDQAENESQKFLTEMMKLKYE